jgi:hypothetical protein
MAAVESSADTTATGDGSRTRAGSRIHDSMDQASSMAAAVPTSGGGATRPKVASGARLGARAGRAQPGARDERVHRRGAPAMRTTGAPVGRVGRPRRLNRCVIRHGDRSGQPGSSRRGARRTGPLPTGLFAERGRDGRRPVAGRPIGTTAGAPELSWGQVRRRCDEDRRGPAGIRPAEVVTPPGDPRRPDSRRPGRSRRSLSSPATLLGRGRTTPEAL